MGMIFTAIGGEGSVSDAFDSFLLNVVIASIISVIGSLLILFGRYKLLIGLMPGDKVGFLKAVVAIVVIISLIGIISFPIIFNDLKGAFKDIESESTGEDDAKLIEDNLGKFEEKTWVITTINSVLSLIEQVLFLLCFYFAYEYQKRNPQLRKGYQPPPSSPYAPPPIQYPPPPY